MSIIISVMRIYKFKKINNRGSLIGSPKVKLALIGQANKRRIVLKRKNLNRINEITIFHNDAKIYLV